MSMDGIGHRRLRPESAFAVPEQAARFRRDACEPAQALLIEPHELETSLSSRARPLSRTTTCRPVTLMMSNREQHGQTTTLWSDREGISLADRSASHGAISARLVHAGHSSRDEARRRDDIAYFLRDDDSCAHRFAFFLAHHPSRRAGGFASSLAAADIGGGTLVALCACVCDHHDRLAVRIAAWLVDLAILCGPSTRVGRRLSPGDVDREMARDHGMGIAPDDHRPCRGRDGTYVHLSRPDHAADAAGEPDGSACQKPEAGGGGD